MPYAKWAVNSQSLSHLSLFLSYHRQNNSLSHSGRLVNTILQISCFTSLKLKQTKKPVCSQKWYIVMFVLKDLSSILVEYIIKGWENGGTLDLSVVIRWEVMRTATVSTPVWKGRGAGGEHVLGAEQNIFTGTLWCEVICDHYNHYIFNL